MKFSVERASLLDAVSKLQRIVGSKTSLPVLEGILISAEQGKLTLISYNLEMGLKKEIYANCEKKGDIVINARILSDILRRMNGIQVEIESDERLMCHIKSGEAVFDIMGMSANDFPEMPSVAEGKKINLDGDILCNMVKGTIFAVAQVEGTRPILTGINVTIKRGVMQFVAIDGYRLAIRRQKVNINEDFSFILSGKAINEAVKLIGEENKNIEIIVGQRLISFNIDGYKFISRLLEGEFVNFEKIIPSEYKQSVNINSHDITDTIERVSLLISDTFSTPVRCIFSEDKLVLSSATSMGRATENFEIKLSGEPFEIGLNSRYLLEALKACDQGEINFKFNGSNAGVILTSADEKNKDFLYLIMPMRLK
ncbi:MAG: DNA polymerase III subunit beta [Clostridia bacterium]|nr:DNA polymerase III subunit beta [Clostridia bacterium]